MAAETRREGHPIDSQRLNDWLAAVSTTEEEEIDCDALFEIVEQVVEAALGGADVRQVVPHVATHLDHCPDCREWYETLVALFQEEGLS